MRDSNADAVLAKGAIARQLGNLSDHPGFCANWRPTTSAVLENRTYGSVRHRVVLAPDGTPLYDFPHIVEPGGAALLPYTRESRVALLRIERPALLKRSPQGSYPDFLLPNDYGRLVWEAPRGYRDLDENICSTAFRELFEETRLAIHQLEYVGSVAANSALLSTPVDLYVGMVEDSSIPVGETIEGIREVKFFSLAGIRELIDSGELICSLTLALLFIATTQGNLK
jgi:8-oxo-dGTP pyrophosphatase MutT (NUDIX family)